VSSVLRTALIGLGSAAERIHIPAIRQSGVATLVAGCDPTPARQAAARDRGVPEVYATAAELLERVRPEAVIVAAPPAAHHELCLLALEHGAHVFCEKPFVGSVAEADGVVAAATRAGRVVTVNNQYRYMPFYSRTRDYIADGSAGRLFLAQCWQQMYHPPSMETNWRATLVRSTLFEFGTHLLDLLCFFFDALPVSVMAHMPRVVSGIDADVVVVLTLRFPDERVASVVLNRVSRAPMRYFEMRLDCTEASFRISLGGVARASVGWSGRPSFRASFVRGGESRMERDGRSTTLVRTARPAFASATAINLQRFAAAIAQGSTDTGALRHARELIRILCAAYESAETGRVVDLTATQPA
jgi:predicted dehydrogenase